VRGLYVSDDSNYSYLGVRGFLRPGDYNTRVLVLLDGHRLNDNIYDSVYFGHEMLDVGAIDRVEIVRGPSSSVYGSNAFFGVINLVSKRGRQLDGIEATGDAGTFGAYSGRVSYGKRFAGDAEVFLSASYYDSRGRGRIYYPEFDQRISLQPEATHNGVAENSDAERAVNFVGNVTLGDFTVSGFWSARMKQVPTASFAGAFNDPRERTDDDRGYVDVRYDHNLSSDVQLHGRAYWDYYSYYGDYPDDAGNPGSPSSVVISKDSVVGKWVGAEAQVTAKILRRHTLVAGIEFRQNLQQKQVSYFDTLPLVYDINDDRRSHTFAFYAQGEMILRPDLLLNAGLRYDDYSDVFGRTINPRLGLVYNPTERTTLKVLYGEAFRAPNVYEQFYYPNPSGAGLRPERIHTTEVTLEQDFARHYRLSLSAYRYNVRDLISQSPATEGFSYYANLDHAAATGAECELEGRFAAGLRARASYAFQRSEDLATHEELTNSPRHLAKLGVIYPFARERFTAGLELQYQGTVRTLAGAAARSFLLGNLTLTARVPARNLEISASAYNLFDTHYEYPGSADHTQDLLPQPGRTFRLKVTTKF
jgi:iron complex outermembrane receptor protein